MMHDSKFGPAAQTVEQRLWVLDQMLRMIPSLKKRATAYTQQLYARYVAGELSWSEVSQARDAVPASGSSPEPGTYYPL